MPARRSDLPARLRPGSVPACSRIPRAPETAAGTQGGTASARLAPALLGLTLAAALAAMPQAAFAQARGVVERNLPPIVGTTGGLAQGNAPATPAEDTAPLGTDLTGIRLIGPDVAVTAKPRSGLSFTGIEGVPAARLDAALKPFLGKPLSRKLVADIQAAIAKTYRGAGRPFVSVTAPPQEVTSGVLQLRVVPFKAGSVKVDDPANAAATDAALAASVRAPQGQIIEGTQVSEDLDWINRYPYRQLNGVFEPGSTPGSSDLTLEVSRAKPWQAYAGWANTGTKETDLNRYFVGFGAGIEALHDLTLSYQLTGSGNLLSNPASINLSGTDWPSYVSQAGRLALPTFARQSIEVAPSFVATSQDAAGDLLTFQNTTFELPILYRSALSNLSSSLAGWGEIYGGVTPRWLSRKTWYQGTDIAEGSAGVFDLVAGWAGSWDHAEGGSTALDVRLLVNPGGLVPGNNDATWETFSNGRVTSAEYAYLYATLTQVTPLVTLPGLSGATFLKGFSWNTSLTGQIAGQALPDTEQLAIGGYYGTRGYTLDDGSVDAGLVLRDELRLPTFPLLGALGLKAPGIGALDDVVSPYAFLDVGYGYNYNLNALQSLEQNANTTLVGLGAGIDYTLAHNVQAGALAGVALTNGPETDRGTVTVQGRVSIAF
ncbi:ShlB/FhaC/HecB family hemolysin secretion/activation protein [Segnochrobactrum spirostomi]|nr:ShlB/FhaC/HecB family hemolysin secretion/activation protein [Segnochrobactrum spirostomi]